MLNLYSYTKVPRGSYAFLLLILALTNYYLFRLRVLVFLEFFNKSCNYLFLIIEGLCIKQIYFLSRDVLVADSLKLESPSIKASDATNPVIPFKL